MDLVEAVGLKIKGLRERHGLSQDQLAESAGTTQVAIWRIENGKVATNLKMLEAIAKQLDVDAFELLKDAQRDRTKSELAEASKGGSQQFAQGPKALLIDLISTFDDFKAEALLTFAKHIAATSIGDSPLQSESLKDNKGKKGSGKSG